MSAQRVISESTGLYRLSIVNKQKNKPDEEAPPSPEKPETPKKGLPLSSPVKTGAPSVPPSPRDSRSSGNFSEVLLYELAAKRRQVVELKQHLAQAERELEALEHQCKEMSTAEKPIASPEKIQELTNKLQETWKGVKSKQSISNLFGTRNQAAQADSARSTTTPREPPKKPSYLQITSEKLQRLKESKSGSPFFDKLVSKWQDFAVNEADEETFDEERPTEKYYIKSKLDYDDDEEVPSETDSESEAHSGITDLGDEAVVALFRRQR